MCINKFIKKLFVIVPYYTRGPLPLNDAPNIFYNMSMMASIVTNGLIISLLGIANAYLEYKKKTQV
jgi:hypothetical protein